MAAKTEGTDGTAPPKKQNRPPRPTGADRGCSSRAENADQPPKVAATVADARVGNFKVVILESAKILIK